MPTLNRTLGSRMSECSVVILDDQPASIARHQNILATIGTRTIIVNDLAGLADVISKTRDLILFLDQHIAEVYDLRELGSAPDLVLVDFPETKGIIRRGTLGHGRDSRGLPRRCQQTSSAARPPPACGCTID